MNIYSILQHIKTVSVKRQCLYLPLKSLFHLITFCGGLTSDSESFQARQVPVYEMIYAPLVIPRRMATALFVGSNLNCVFERSPGNFFNNIVVASCSVFFMYRSSKSLPDSFWGSAPFFISYISVKNKMFVKLLRFMSE